MERRPWRTDLDTLALIYAAIAVGSLAADQPIKPPEEKEKGMFSRIFGELCILSSPSNAIKFRETKLTAFTQSAVLINSCVQRIV